MFKRKVTLKVDFLNTEVDFEKFSNSEVYMKYTSFQQKSRSVNEVLLNYKQSTFSFFSVFILSLKVYFYLTSRI